MEDTAKSHTDLYTKLGIGAAVCIGLYLVGWSFIFWVVMWLLTIVAFSAALYLAYVARTHDSNAAAKPWWIGAGVAFVSSLFLFVAIPSGSSSGTVGLPKEKLTLAAHTVIGSWQESDLFGPQTQEWTGSAGVLRRANGKLTLLSNSHCLGLGELRSSDNLTDGVPEIADYTISIRFASGKQKRVLRFADQDGALDLSLLEVDASGLKEGVDYVLLTPLRRDSSAGDDVVAVGSPHGFEGTQTFGRISALREMTEPQYHRLIQVDAAINPGNSGGPLFVNDGKGLYWWVGVNTWKVSGADNLGFAIDSRDAIDTDYRWFSCDAIGASNAISHFYE